MAVISDSFNDSRETEKLYSEVTASYQFLADYGWLRDFQHLQIVNLTNEELQLSIQKDLGGPIYCEILIPASSSRTWDDFWHKGRIEYKATSVLPTQGKLIVTSW